MAFTSPSSNKNSDGRWATSNMEVYVDTDGKKFGFAPPNGNIQHFIDEVILPMGHDTCRGGYDILPPWVNELAAQQQQHTCSTPAPTNKVRRLISSVTPRLPRKRKSPEKARIRALEEHAKQIQAQLDSALEHIDFLEGKVKYWTMRTYNCV